MTRIAAVLVALAASLPAYAQPQSAAAPSETPGQPDEEQTSDPEIVVEGERPKRICENQTSTGSIIPRRICRSPEQVAADQERARVIKDRLSRERETAQHTAESRGNR